MRLDRLSSLGLICVLAAGCVAVEEAPSTSASMARVQVDTARLGAFAITRVTAEASGISADLTLDYYTGTFIGALMLPVGAHDLVVTAYEGAAVVGRSNPTPVVIDAGIVTQVSIRIFATGDTGQPAFGPIVESVVYPASAQAGATVAFSVSAVSPSGDPLSVQWWDSCTDSSYSDPYAASTAWTKATAGSCHVNVEVSASGQYAHESFSIVVFPAGANSGAAGVDAEFVFAPELELQLYYGAQSFCSASHYTTNASCARPIASPTLGDVYAYVSWWGNSGPGTIEVFDSCGGSSHVEYEWDNAWQGRWRPPVQRSVCFVSARATNADGISTTRSVAILVQDGVPYMPTAPAMSMEIYHSDGHCFVHSSWPDSECGNTFANGYGLVWVWADWFDGTPGSIDVADDCGGMFFETYSEPGRVVGDWELPSQPGVVCTLTASGANLEGGSSQALARFTLY